MERKLVWRNVADLIPYARNSRIHSDEQVAQIAASIKEFGWTNPILTDGKNGLVAGHGRLLAARKLGQVKVPIIELTGLSDAQKKAYIIADNKLALNAGWDDEVLKVELAELKELDFNLDITGFSALEIAGLSLEEKDLYPDSSAKEIDPDDYNMGHQCPKCGFEFDDNK